MIKRVAKGEGFKRWDSDSARERVERERDGDDDESLYTHASAFGVFFITCKRLGRPCPSFFGF